MTESEISKRLVKELRAAKCKIFNAHGHAMQEPGWPDIWIAYRGISAWVEFKGVATVLKPLQKQCIKDIKYQGNNALVCRFLTDCVFIFEDENGKLLCAFTFNSWKEAAAEFLRSLREVVGGETNGTGTDTELLSAIS